MSNVEEKLVKSLTGGTTAIIPYLPYLLQDLWEMGSSPKEINDLISTHIPVNEKTRILDLACGKAAVSIHLAKAFGCQVKGIDIVPEFIAYAVKKANVYGVDSLCQFEVQDINKSVENERGYDIVVLAAIGDVLGNILETITKLKGTVHKNGYLLIDDAFSNQDGHKTYFSQEQWLSAFRDAGVRLIAEKTIDDQTMESVNQYNQTYIVKRAHELQKLHPDQADLFADYIQRQQAECEQLQNDVTGVIWLLQVVS